MITFVLAAAVLVGALCVAVAFDGGTTEAPPDVLAARLLATDQTVPVSLLLDAAETIGEPHRQPSFLVSREGARLRPFRLCLVKPEPWKPPPASFLTVTRGG
jgi:hypothetical protein